MKVKTLFGVEEINETPSGHSIPRAGYANIPGTGPKGESCRTCRHLYRHVFSKTYLKCDLVNWTHGAATDIRAKSPACLKWEPREEGK